MQRLPTFLVFLILTATALSGCSSKEDKEHGENIATLQGTGYDRAVGNDGFRISGSLTGAAEALGAGSAVQIDALDIVADDSGGANDKASIILDARQAGLEAHAGLRSMAGKSELQSAADHFGGVGRNVKVFGSTGVGPAALPEVTAFLFVSAFANLKIGDKLQPGRLVYIALVPAIRDHHSHEALTAADADDAQLHIIFPGSSVAGGAAIDGVPDGFLYYYFETVGVSSLSDSDKAKIGETLVKPETANTLPIAVGKVYVGDKVATSATKNDKKNVTVTFDGSESSDAEGAVTRWVWRVGELTSDNTYKTPEQDLAVVVGEKVEYTFSSPGAKLIELTVVDTQGATSSINLNFYVNFHRIQPGGGSYQSQAAGGGATCGQSINCFQNTTSVFPGFVSATYTAKKNGTSTQIQGFHVDLYPPGTNDPTNKTPVKKSDKDKPLTVTAADLKGVTGPYVLWVWYEVGASTGGPDGDPQTLDAIYDIESNIVYAPTIA